MHSSDNPSRLEPIRPGIAARWLAATARVHIVGDEQLPAQGTIIVVRQNQTALFGMVYSLRLPKRQGFVYPETAIEDVWQASADRLSSGQDGIVSLAAEANTAHLKLIEVFRLARATACPIFPVGIGVAHSREPDAPVRLRPGARAVMVFEAPFHVPRQPDHIPEAWGKAVIHLMEKANGQAQDLLATWKHRGRLPST